MLLGVTLHAHDTGTNSRSWRGYAGKHTVRVHRAARAKQWTACLNVGRVCLVAKAPSWAELGLQFQQRLLQHFTTLPAGFSPATPHNTGNVIPETGPRMSEKKVDTVEAGEEKFEKLLLALAETVLEFNSAKVEVSMRTARTKDVQRALDEATKKQAAQEAKRAELMQQLKEVFADSCSAFDNAEARAETKGDPFELAELRPNGRVEVGEWAIEPYPQAEGPMKHTCWRGPVNGFDALMYPLPGRKVIVCLGGRSEHCESWQVGRDVLLKMAMDAAHKARMRFSSVQAGSIAAEPELGKPFGVTVHGVATILKPVVGGWSGSTGPNRRMTSVYRLPYGYLVLVPGDQQVTGTWEGVLPLMLKMQ